MLLPARHVALTSTRLNVGMLLELLLARNNVVSDEQTINLAAGLMRPGSSINLHVVYLPFLHCQL